MLTIEHLSTVPPADRTDYLRSLAAEMKRDEIMVVQSRNEEQRAKDVAVRRETAAADARAYLAALEAAGLWPVPAPTGER